MNKINLYLWKTLYLMHAGYFYSSGFWPQKAGIISSTSGSSSPSSLFLSRLNVSYGDTKKLNISISKRLVRSGITSTLCVVIFLLVRLPYTYTILGFFCMVPLPLYLWRHITNQPPQAPQEFSYRSHPLPEMIWNVIFCVHTFNGLIGQPPI